VALETTMNTNTIMIQLRSLEAQLAVLRVTLKQNNGARKSFGHFYGVLAGKSETSETELAEAELKISFEFDK
jgi:hypothetical protein